MFYIKCGSHTPKGAFVVERVSRDVYDSKRYTQFHTSSNPLTWHHSTIETPWSVLELPKSKSENFYFRTRDEKKTGRHSVGCKLCYSVRTMNKFFLLIFLFSLYLIVEILLRILHQVSGGFSDLWGRSPDTSVLRKVLL